MMECRHLCVIDKFGAFKAFVRADFDGDKIRTIYGYEQKESDILLAVPPPKEVKPCWNGTDWEESATPAEIAAWEAEHPAPPMPPALPPDPRDLAITQLMREVAALKAKEAETIG